MASITVYPRLSPRVVEVDAPDTDIDVQDLYNLIRDWEDSAEGDLYPYIVDAAGKEDLGGGTVVGITVTLQNAYVRFAARNTVHSTGTATTGDTDGKILTDAVADFTAEGTLVGDLVFNSTSGAMETVHTVGTTTLQSFGLVGGSRQDWQIGDVYNTYLTQVCNISGGNLVAVDNNGSTINAVFNAPNVNYTKVSSSSATLTTQNLEDLKYLLESQRDSHSAFREAWYVSPYLGSSTASGSSPESPVDTFAAAQALASDGDVVFFQDDDPSGTTTLIEHLNITKKLLLRGPGPQFEIAPTTDLNDGYRYATVYVGADDVEVSGLRIKTGPGTTRVQRALKIDADRCRAENLVIEDAHDIGIYIQNSDDVHCKNIRIKGADQAGVYTQIGDTPQLIKLENMHLNNCTVRGFSLRKGVDIFIIGATVVRDSGLGFYIDSGVTNLYIEPSYISTNNTTPDVFTPSGELVFLQDKFKDRIWTPSLDGNEALNKLIWGAK